MQSDSAAGLCEARNVKLSQPCIGQPAPDIELVDRGGNPWHLTDQRGRVVVLIFHRHVH